MRTPEQQLLPEIPGFRVIEEIGRGATSRVYRAAQTALDREVALKIITTLGEKGQRRALRLFREARLSGALDHPGIVRGIDAGEGQGFCWFAMDLVDGEGMDELLEREKRLPLGEVLGLAEDILEALDHIHRRGVTHRDIKPANILIDVDGHPRLLDLGLARRATDPGLTQEGGAVGTPQYMSPEQAREPDRVDGRSDLFSLGATLYRAITGVAPFDAETVGEVLTRLLHDHPRRPSSIVPGTPQAVDLVLMRALEKRPEYRYQSANEMLADIRALREGRTTGTARRASMRRAATWASGALLLVVTAWVGYGTLGGGASDDRDTPDAAAIAAAQKRARDLSYYRRLLSQREDLGKYDYYRDLERAAGRLDPDPDARRAVEAARNAYIKRARRVIEKVETMAIDRVRQNSDNDAASLLDEEPVNRALDEDQCQRPLENSPLSAVVNEARESARRRVERLVEQSRTSALESVIDSLEAWERAHRGRLMDRKEVAKQLAEIAGKRKQFTKENEGRVADKIRQIRDAIGRTPFHTWNTAVTAARRHVDARRFVTAERELVDALERVGDLVEGAKEEAEIIRRRIRSGIDAELDRARSIPRLIRRNETLALPNDERTRRVERMQGAYDALGDISEVPGLGPARELARAAIDALSAAIRLRDQVLESAASLAEGEGTSFRPRVRRKGFIQPRTIVQRAGRVLIARDSVGVLRRYDIEELLAPCIAELAAHAGIEVPDHVPAMLAYLDGDDDIALELAQILPATNPLRSLLIELANGAVQKRLESFDSAEDRDAYGRLVEARRRIAAADFAGARAELSAIDAIKKRPGWSKRPFWRAHGSEVTALRKDVATHSTLETAWRGFGRFARIEGDTRRIILKLPLGDATEGLARLAPPPRAKTASDGIRLIGADHLATTAPDRVPPLLLDVPSLTHAAIDLSFEVVFEEGAFPASFLSLSLHDAHFIAFGKTLDDRPFRHLPLHGLERQIYRKNTVGRAGLWVGAPGEYEAHLRRPGKALQLPSNRSIPVRLRSEPGGKELTVFIGKTHSFTLQRARRPVLREGGLRISGFPTVRISNLSLDVRIQE